MTSAAASASQRTHRAPIARRAIGRVAVTSDHVARLAPRLTARDRWLARMLAEYKVLTAPQIAELAFPSQHAARSRLVALYRWRVLDRFQPYTGRGAAPYHYVLDTAGAALLAHEDGIDPRELQWRHDDALGIADSLRLAHTVTANGFFTALVAAARQPHSADAASPDSPAGARLTAWWPEVRCARHFADHVRPDGYGRWTATERESGAGAGARSSGRAVELEFFTEIDMGTEILARLTGKLAGYAALAAATGITTPVLFWFRTTTREAHARRSLAAALANLDHPDTVPVATAAADSLDTAEPAPAGRAAAPRRTSGPAGAVWLPVRPARPNRRPDRPGRVRLAQLPAEWPQLQPTPTPAPPPAADTRTPTPTPTPNSRAAGRPRLTAPPPMPPTPVPLTPVPPTPLPTAPASSAASGTESTEPTW